MPHQLAPHNHIQRQLIPAPRLPPLDFSASRRNCGRPNSNAAVTCVQDQMLAHTLPTHNLPGVQLEQDRDTAGALQRLADAIQQAASMHETARATEEMLVQLEQFQKL